MRAGRRAVVIGGTGAIGCAVAERLVPAGWELTITARHPERAPARLAALGVDLRAGDRRDVAHLREVLGAGADLLVDCACFTAGAAGELLPLLAGVGSTVMLSGKAVYVDDAGRHVNSPEPPRFPLPIGEDQPTLPPSLSEDFDSAEGYGTCKVGAEQVLLQSGHPVSVLRASKVHGAGARRPREWVVVKRVLDRRPVVLLAGGGDGVDHTTAAANVASLIETVAERPGSRVLNAADPDAPSARAIVEAVAGHLGWRFEEVRLERPADALGGLGATPWDQPFPIVLDVGAALALGWRPAGEYSQTVASEVAWLLAAATGGEDAELAPALDDPFFRRFFDYAAEDAWLASRRLPPSGG